MTTLVVEPLVTTLEQNFLYKLEGRATLLSIAPYLLMNNAPSGTFTFTLLKGATTVYSKTFTSADIKTALNTTRNYAHVFYPIVPELPLLIEKGEYTAKLSATGYTYAAATYLGWIRQHEDLNEELEYVSNGISTKPLAMRRKILKQGIHA